MRPDGDELGWMETIADLWVELSLLMPSYARVFLIMAIRIETQSVSTVCWLLFLTSACSGFLVVNQYQKLSGQTWDATAVEDRDYEVLGIWKLICFRSSRQLNQIGGT
jgi:hypothetical protein